ncbi:MAG: hypothetical protein QY323_05130 [Patescibacteria group bacterium]|nr:MAG: hypothetical protein QY323_05130 [Patescibacteria group bacterium]
MDDPDPGFLSDRAKSFLTALREACIAEGFAAPMEPALVAGERWQATLELPGRLGRFTCTLWTSWALLEYDGDHCRLELRLGNEELRPVYRCVGIEGFQEEFEYLRLTVDHFHDPQDLARFLHLGADREWRAKDRANFVANLRRLAEAGGAKKVGSA